MVDIKGENEMDTSKKVAAHRLKKKPQHWKRFRNHKLTGDEMGEEFLHFRQHHPSWWPAHWCGAQP